MTTEKVEEIVLEISTQLGILNTQTKQVLDTLQDHNERISKLEEHKESLKDTTVQWLVKALIASIAVIGSLTGAGTLLSKILGAE